MQKYLENFKEWNEEMIEKYNPDRYHNSRNPVIRFIEYMRTRRIIEFLDPQNGDKILDLGCGAGNIMQKIKKGELFGVDISDTLLKIAGNKKYDRPVTFLAGDVESLPPEILENKYDKIFCSEVLEHVLHPQKVIDEILKVSHPGTTVVISIPNEEIINKIKNTLIRFKIFNFLFPNVAKNMMDEWHIHSASSDFLKEIVGDKLVLLKSAYIPCATAPIRLVVKYGIKSQ